MKKNVKRLQITLSAMIITAFLLVPFTVNGQSKANFAGTWALNAEKSNMGQGQAPQGQAPQGQGQGQGQRMGGGMGGNFVAKQEANLLTVERTRQGQDGQSVTTSTKYTLDGKETVNSTQRGESKSTATWSADGKSLKIATTSSFGDMTMTTTEEWTLTSPTLLSIKSTRRGQDGTDRVTTMVYDKK
jgi:hypothetical protein